jgi:hypothetical protein
MKMRYWSLALALLIVGGFAYRTANRHEIKYLVHGQSGSKNVVISYLDTAHYGYFQHKDLKRIRVPATSLPWSTVVHLPKNALAQVEVKNENGAKSRFKISIFIDGGETLTVPSAPYESLSDLRVIR